MANQEDWKPKVGDLVRIVKSPYVSMDNGKIGTIIKVGKSWLTKRDVVSVVFEEYKGYDGLDWGFYFDEIEPVGDNS